MLAAPPEPVSNETLITGRDDGSYLCAPPSRADDDGAAAACTELAGQPSPGRAGVDVAAVGWAPPAKRPRTRRKAAAADPSSKPGPRDDDAGEGARATTALELIGTDTAEQVVTGDKLMADAMRAGYAHDTSASDVTTKRNNNLIIDGVDEAMENIIGNESSKSAAAGASESSSKETVAFFPGNAFVSDALRATLARLGAADLKCVHKKAMLASDRSSNQNRLLISCKTKMTHGEQVPFAGILTDKERPLVHRPEPEETAAAQQQQQQPERQDSKKKAKGKGNNKKKGKNKKKAKGKGEEEGEMSEDDHKDEKKKNTEKGLSVRAYDRDGRAYDVQLKYLTSNCAYRIKGPNWRVFLTDNGLLAGDEEPQDAAGDVHIEVWAFRSPEVALIKDNGELVPDHPHGALGLLLLHRRDGEVCIGGAGAAEEGHGAAPDGVADEQPRQQDGHGGAAAAQDEEGTGAHEVVAGGDAHDVVAGAAVEPGAAAVRDPRVTGVLQVMAAICLVSMKNR